MNNLKWLLLNIRFHLMEFLMNKGLWANKIYVYISPSRGDKVNVFNLWRFRRFLLATVSDEHFSMKGYVYPESRGAARCMIAYTYRMFTGKDIVVWRPKDFLPRTVHHIYGFNTKDHEYLMQFLFGSAWQGQDDTRLGACNRIKFVLMNDNYEYVSPWEGAYQDISPYSNIYALWYRLYSHTY